MLIIANKKISEDDIDGLQETLGINLPNELKNFLLKYNGGETPNTSIDYNGISSDIKAFYGIGDVYYSFNDVSIDDNQGSYLPIALDSFGNYFLIDLNNGHILFDDHENNSMKEITMSLKELIDHSISSGNIDDKKKTVSEREKEMIARGKGNHITDELKHLWKEEYDKYKNAELVKVEL